MSFISGSESTINSARARSIFSYAESEGDDELNDVHYMDDIGVPFPSVHVFFVRLAGHALML